MRSCGGIARSAQPVVMNILSCDFKIDASIALPDDEVQLWRVDLDSIRSQESRWQELLSPDEAERAARFHFAADRQRFVAGRALLRTILAGYLASPPSEISFSYSAREKPSLFSGSEHSLSFNLSHSGGIALYAFSRGREIGVDVEQIRTDFDVEGIARRFFSAREQEQLTALPHAERVEAFFRCWTRKEAYIKATGDGLSLPLTQFDVSLNRGGSNALLATRPDGSEAGRWRLNEVAAGDGFVAAICVRGVDWKLRDWCRPAFEK